MSYKSGLGYLVTSAQIANTGAPINVFTVTGLVCVTAVFSLIAVASGANACGWEYDPTTGTASQPLCATGDINVGLVGDYVSITETAGVATLTTGGAVAMGSPRKYFLPAGILTFINAAADGSLIHNLFYIPITAGARIALS